jgi:hypothetical protein
MTENQSLPNASSGATSRDLSVSTQRQDLVLPERPKQWQIVKDNEIRTYTRVSEDELQVHTDYVSRWGPVQMMQVFSARQPPVS